LLDEVHQAIVLDLVLLSISIYDLKL